VSLVPSHLYISNPTYAMGAPDPSLTYREVCLYVRHPRPQSQKSDLEMTERLGEIDLTSRVRNRQ
jgi:hypothetical protein